MRWNLLKLQCNEKGEKREQFSVSVSSDFFQMPGAEAENQKLINEKSRIQNPGRIKNPHR
jgi:hypothetical protein